MILLEMSLLVHHKMNPFWKQSKNQMTQMLLKTMVQKNTNVRLLAPAD